VALFVFVVCNMTEKIKSVMKTVIQQNFLNLMSFNLEILII